MKDFSIRQVLGLMANTAPFLAFRFLIYCAITLMYLIATATGAAVGYFIGSLGEDPGSFAVWGALIGFAGASLLIYFLREYLLYLVKAGHIAVLVELMDGKTIPSGRAQIDHAQRVVRERFAQSSLLFAVDQLIKAVLRTFNRTFFAISFLLPVPGVRGVVKLVNTVINLSLTYVDEVILAYDLRSGTGNPWKAARVALVLYAQNYKAFLKNAFFLALVIWGLTFLVFFLVLAPIAGLASIVPGAAGPVAVLIAVVFAWGVKQAIIEPIAMTSLMQAFFKVTEGQTPNPEWEQKLDRLSAKFRALKDKGAAWDTDGEPGESAAQRHPA
jgi:hypothetical protein